MSSDAVTLDIGEYCRRVEEHLTRVNGGHLVRIVGPAFELVRSWADAGVPLNLVLRGIDLKAERHREGRRARPLRVEFCEADVREAFENWRRAVGIGVGGEKKKPGLWRHLDRAVDRLSRVAARMDVSPELRAVCDRVLQELADRRKTLSSTRGAARESLLERLSELDAELSDAVRAFAPEAARTSAHDDAVADLAGYRARLAPAVWERSVAITTDRLLRDRLGLPQLSL